MRSSVAARVLSVNVGPVVDGAWAGRLKRTAIDKRPITGDVTVDTEGLAGDEQADREHHGGIDRAVYAYAREDLDRWSGLLGRPLPNGVFGENLTTEGHDSSEIVIGERWAIGSAVFEVSAPRIPCGVFAAWLHQKDWVKRFAADRRPGPYLRVVAPGSLAPGDAIRVTHQPAHGVTLGLVLAAAMDEPELAPRVLPAVGVLPSGLRGRILRSSERHDISDNGSKSRSDDGAEP